MVAPLLSDMRSKVRPILPPYRPKLTNKTGAFKYGGYEVGKKFYGDAFPNVNKNLIYIAASASAEAVADLFLCPFEAIKVRIQTQIPVKERSIAQGWAKITANGGISQLYNGFWPLLGRQVPYTVIKVQLFSSFHEAVD